MGVAVEPHTPAAHLDRLRALVEEGLAGLVPAPTPERLYEPVRYVLSGRGKRLRPLLLLLSAEAHGVPAPAALPAALGVEVFHNFTLVHDDIMDHSDERRGRPTVHVRWSEDTAILAGDYLLALSYDLLARTESPSLARLLRRYGAMVTALCEGQTLDKAFETQPAVTVADYLAMIDRKTAALLCWALEAGALLGGAPAGRVEALGQAGRHLGRAFQIQDDLLDLVADDGRWGKPVGGDLMEGKKTYLLLTALERAGADDDAFFRRIAEGTGLPPSDVADARERMRRLGVLDAARQAVDEHTEAGLSALDTLPESPARTTLHWLFRRMQARLH